MRTNSCKDIIILYLYVNIVCIVLDKCNNIRIGKKTVAWNLECTAVELPLEWDSASMSRFREYQSSLVINYFHLFSK